MVVPPFAALLAGPLEHTEVRAEFVRNRRPLLSAVFLHEEANGFVFFRSPRPTSRGPRASGESFLRENLHLSFFTGFVKGWPEAAD